METTVIIEPCRVASSREASFQALYEMAFPGVAGFVRKMNGSFQDARDIFQDALVIYLEKSEGPGFASGSSPERYILGIAKHLWLRKFREDRRKVSLNITEMAISIPVDFYPSVHIARLLRFLELTGKRCLDLLHGIYYEKRSMKDLAAAFGYRNEHTTSVQKYKCLEKLRSAIKEKTMAYEDFFE